MQQKYVWLLIGLALGFIVLPKVFGMVREKAA